MSILNKNELLELVAENKAEKAFELLTHQFRTIIDKQNAFFKEEYSQLALLNGRLKEIKQQQLQGTIDSDLFFVRKNKINYALVEFLNKLPEFFWNLEEFEHEFVRSHIKEVVHETLPVEKGDFEFDIFLCYSSIDTKAAGKIYRTLSQAGYTVFFSEEKLKNEAGLSYFEKIEHALIHSKNFLLLCTSNAIQSEWVKVEYETYFNECYLKEKTKRRFFILEGEGFTANKVPLLLRRIQYVKDIPSLISSIEKQKRDDLPPVQAVKKQVQSKVVDAPAESTIGKKNPKIAEKPTPSQKSNENKKAAPSKRRKIYSIINGIIGIPLLIFLIWDALYLNLDEARTLVKRQNYFHSEWNPSGESLSYRNFSSPSKYVVLDKKMKLMWQKNLDTEATAVNYAEAKAYIKALNRQKFGGYNDWRLPRATEILTILDRKYKEDIHEKNDGSRTASDFPTIGNDLEKSRFWTSTKAYPQVAWVMSVHGAFFQARIKDSYSVKAVRTVKQKEPEYALEPIEYEVE